MQLHPTYNAERFEKLCRMFAGDPRQGNEALYIREHFDLKRICESCGRRTTEYLAVPSIIAEGSDWVFPFSVTRDGRIRPDLEESIPDHSNFLAPPVVQELGELSILYNPHGSVRYVIPVEAGRESLNPTAGAKITSGYKEFAEQFPLRIWQDVSDRDLLKWDTEVQYAWHAHYFSSYGLRTNGYSVQFEYVQWLASHKQLIVVRASDHGDATVALAYLVLGDYGLTLLAAKCVEKSHLLQGFKNFLLLELIEDLQERGVTTQINIGERLVDESDEEVWHLEQVAEPRLQFSNAIARQTLIDAFGSI